MLSDRLRTAWRWTIVFLMAAVPLAFNTDTFDVFNLTKFTLVLVATIVIVGLWIAETVQRRRLIYPKTGIELPMLALLVTTGLATAASFAKVISILGFYKSYDGLISIAAFTILGLATADVFDDKRQVKSAFYSLVFVGGLLSAIYGVLQYVTFVTEGRIKLDWELWGAASFKTSSIFSTYGNPNHFAGFLAICLPIAVVLIAISSDLLVKGIGWVFAGLAFLEILQTQSRGSWAALAVVAVALGMLFSPEIRKRPAPFLATAGASVIAFLFAALVLRGRTNLFSRLLSMFSAGDSSSRQRILLWEAGIRAGLDRPIFGWGIDTFRVVFLRYQGFEFFRLYGPNQIANGPHNVFISWFYSAGILGLGAFLWLLGAVFVPAWRMANACKRAETIVAQRFRRGFKVNSELRELRLLIGGGTISVLSFLVVESFNVNQIGITFLLYTLAPLTAKLAYLSRPALSDAAKSIRIEPEELVPPRLVKVLASRLRQRAKDAEEGIYNESRFKKGSNAVSKPIRSASNSSVDAKDSFKKIDSKSKKAATARKKANPALGKKSRSRRQDFVPEKLRVSTAIFAVAYVVLAVPLAWQSVRPYRADHIYRKFVPEQESAKSAMQQWAQGNNPSLEGVVRDYASSTRDLIDKAVRRNPWESRYRYDQYEVSRIEAWMAKSPNTQVEALESADRALLEGIRLSPEEARFYKTRGELMNYWGGARGNRFFEKPLSVDRSKLLVAIEALQLARRYNPYDLDVDAELMKTALALDDKKLIFDAGCHGFELGDARVTVDMANTLARDGYVTEAVELLRYYLRRFDYSADVANSLGEVTATAPPSTEAGAKEKNVSGELTQNRTPLEPCFVAILEKSRH
ncbi:MAG: hypothetical protein C4317_00745 [Acidimicrobiia bacterium]